MEEDKAREQVEQDSQSALKSAERFKKAWSCVMTVESKSTVADSNNCSNDDRKQTAVECDNDDNTRTDSNSSTN